MVALGRKILTASVLGAVAIGGLGVSSALAAPADGQFLISAINEENPELTGQAGYVSTDKGGEVTPPVESPNNIEAPQANLVFALDFSGVSWSADPDNKCEVVNGYCTPGPGWGANRPNVGLYDIPQQWVDGVQAGTYSVELKTRADRIDGVWAYIVQEDGTPLTKDEFRQIFPGTNYADIQAEVNRRVSAEWSTVDQFINPDEPLRMASESWKFNYDSSMRGLSIKPLHNVLETRFAEAVDAQTDYYVYAGNMASGGAANVVVPSDLIVTDLETGERKTFPINIELQLPS